MGMLASIFEKRDLQPGTIAWAKALVNAGYSTKSGITVNPEQAMRVSAVFACIRVLAETIGSLPLVVYRRLTPRGKERAQDHYLYEILHDQPNPEMTSFDFREALMGHVLGWGNGMAEIEVDGAGRVKALWPLRPDQTQLRRVDGQLFYFVQDPVHPQDDAGNRAYVGRLPAERVFHLHGLGFNGLLGYSVIRYAREAIGLAMAAEEFGARFFANDATPGVVIKHPQHLSKEALDHLTGSWEELHSALENKHRMAILEEGMSIERIGVPPEEGQWLEIRRFQVAEIARLYRVPLALLEEHEKAATYASVEQFMQSFEKHSIRPWLVRWEQAIRRSLLLPRERATIFSEFLIEGLLRGDTAARYQAYAVGRQWGWLSANDIRDLENQNPIEGGDAYYIPLNMIPASQAAEGLQERALAIAAKADHSAPAAEARSKRAAAGRRRLATAYTPVFVDAARRVIRREIHDVREGARKHFRQRTYAEFSQWLEQFYQEHQAFVERQMAPALRSYAEVVSAAAADEVGADPEVTPELEKFVSEYGEALAARHVGSSIGQVREVTRDAVEAGRDPVEALDERFTEWEERRPEKTASWETIRSNNAVARFVYLAAGILKLRWIASGENCPYCSRLNGRVIGIHDNFLAAGDAFQPDGVDIPLVNDHDVGHPPAHEGCDCMATAAI